MPENMKQGRHKLYERECIPQETKRFIYNECGHICTHCGRPMDYIKDFTLEHVIPLSKGGTNELCNLVALCEVCNQKKGNHIIPPLDYFPFLPKRRKDELQKLFSQYLTSYDWLDFDNLFMTDWFTVEFTKFMSNRNKAILCIPGKARITRISLESAMEHILAYTRQLAKNDRCLMATDIKELDGPFYSVEISGTEIAFFSARVTANLDESDVWRYVILFDWFTSFSVPWRYGIEATIENLIGRIMLQIQDTLLYGSRDTAIPVQVRMPKSSPFALGIQYMIKKSKDAAYVEQWYNTLSNGLYEGCILNYQYIVYQALAGKDILCSIAHKDGHYYIGSKEVFPQDLQKNLISRLKRHEQDRKDARL